MSPPDAIAPGPGPYLQKLKARRDACRAALGKPAGPAHGSWLRRILSGTPAPAPPHEREPSRELVTEIANVLNKYDPHFFVEGGSHPDVYERQARDIASWMSWVQDEEEMHGLVFETFYMAFHLDIPREEGDDEEYSPGLEEDPATYVPIAHDLMAVRPRYFARLGAPSGPPLFEE